MIDRDFESALTLLAIMGSVRHARETREERRARIQRAHWGWWSSRYARQCADYSVDVHGAYDWLVLVEHGSQRMAKWWFRGLCFWQLRDQLRVRGTSLESVRIKKVQPVKADFGAMEID